MCNQGELETAKKLAIEFMSQASYQVECSDEGLMVEEIEACLKPVILDVRSGGPKGAKSWAISMVAADRVGIICDRELEELIDK